MAGAPFRLPDPLRRFVPKRGPGESRPAQPRQQLHQRLPREEGAHALDEIGVGVGNVVRVDAERARRFAECRFSGSAAGFPNAPPAGSQAAVFNPLLVEPFDHPVDEIGQRAFGFFPAQPLGRFLEKPPRLGAVIIWPADGVEARAVERHANIGNGVSASAVDQPQFVVTPAEQAPPAERDLLGQRIEGHGDMVGPFGPAGAAPSALLVFANVAFADEDAQVGHRLAFFCYGVGRRPVPVDLKPHRRPRFFILFIASTPTGQPLYAPLTELMQRPAQPWPSESTYHTCFGKRLSPSTKSNWHREIAV